MSRYHAPLQVGMTAGALSGSEIKWTVSRLVKAAAPAARSRYSRSHAVHIFYDDILQMVAHRDIIHLLTMLGG